MSISTGQKVFAVFAVLFTELYYLSPILMFYKHRKKEITSRQLPLIQVLVNCFNCLHWLILGVQQKVKNDEKDEKKDEVNDSKEEKTDEIQMITCNAIGLAISLLNLLYIWKSFSTNQNFKDNFVYIFMCFNVIFQIFYFFLKSSDVTNYFAIVFNCLMYFSMLENIRKPIFIPLGSAIVGVIACALWIIYGFIYELMETKIANIASCAICGVILIFRLYIEYKHKTDKKKDINDNDKLPSSPLIENNNSNDRKNADEQAENIEEEKKRKQ